MFQHKRIVVWSLALALFALAPRDAAASSTNCTDSYLVCMNDASRYDGGVLGAMGETECGVSWIGCTAAKLKFW